MLPGAPLTQHDYAYFDFLQGYKHVARTSLRQAVLDNYKEKAEAFEGERGYAPSTLAESTLLMANDDGWQFYCGVERLSQMLVWFAGLDTVNPRREEFKAIMDELTPAKPLGRLELHPEMELPAWYTENDIHLQPGGYWADELLGFWFEHTAPLIYRQPDWRYGQADPAYLSGFAHSAPKENYRRILDMGCAFAQSTTALRRAYPDAEEVVGIDLSPSVLRFAHLASEEKGLAITFAQRNAAENGYPDESFDLVTGYSLLHESPVPNIENTLKEAFRVLQPGGHMMFSDAPPYTNMAPDVAFASTYATRHLGEPFSGPFRSLDFLSLVRDAGFINVQAGSLAAAHKHGYVQWVYHADKPSVG